MNHIIKQVCPPIAWQILSQLKQKVANKNLPISNSLSSEILVEIPEHQELEIYWSSTMAESLETWGEKTAWHELKFLMMGLEGKVLDIACGTGKNISDLNGITYLNLYGCDISDFLIRKAVERGLNPDRLKVCDATLTGFEDNFFDYSYSIGSLEHFTEDGIQKAILESYRITKYSSFHQIPVSRMNKNEGWIKDDLQSFFNNSIDWWLEKFNKHYSSVTVLESLWESSMCKGVWFICNKSH
ncbi:class I SAM-dependent methyltransferase [Dolichospermum circinale]|uniref:class I SAM-dependent methyltransferase n=1 Tax=Dolichospermum circinale TaxID=109265 RepID=UPI00232C1482|nr:class I SAM-dependent methyltransferase [Dolichospermum circinale]MDB9456383.1 class I SAM-dependent methyltransferase [Dolichospermum circinale CS-541/06]MDB9462980.1 class I SAM-dependent methyltransferase [Dolichospermum circinale CS-541/04]